MMIPTDASLPEQLEGYFEAFVEDARQVLHARNDRQLISDEAIQYVVQCLQYNVVGGKQTRAKAFLLCVQALSKGSRAHRDNRHHDAYHSCHDDHCCGLTTNFLGIAWCLELLQAFFLVADDVMDGAEERRGRPAWHCRVGLAAVNDVMLLQTLMFLLLERYIPDRQLGFQAQRLVHDVTLRTELGQWLDLQSDRMFAQFCMERWTQIATLKTAYYSFHLPVYLAYLLAPNLDDARGDDAFDGSAFEIENARDDEESVRASIELVALELGRFFQCQDDFLDVFGDRQALGKPGTDVSEGKCSWLAVQALLIMGNDGDQRKLFEEAYGTKWGMDVVRELFRKVQLPLRFEQHAQAEEQRIRALIDDRFPATNHSSIGVASGTSVRRAALRHVFSFLCEKTFGRQR
jgi:farnesyl diphosphate synthase